MAAKKNWMQHAVKKPGALRQTAARHGALKNGIKSGWLKKAAKGKGVSPLTAKRARLALVFKKATKARSNKAKGKK
jgi:transposase-like protein